MDDDVVILNDGRFFREAFKIFSDELTNDKKLALNFF